MSTQIGDKFFVNDLKLQHARDIIAVVAGKKPSSIAAYGDEKFNELKQRWSSHLSEAKLKADEDSLGFVYEKLGGLIRTEVQEKAAKAKVEEKKKRK